MVKVVLDYKNYLKKEGFDNEEADTGKYRLIMKSPVNFFLIYSESL